MPTRTIQAIRVHQYGGLEQLKLERIPCPEPQAGEVLIRVRAAGVIPADWKMRQGFFKNMRPVQFPYIPGSALSGVVEAVGSGVTSFQVGQAVFGRSDNGTYAEYVTTSVDTLALKPSTLSFDEAATLIGGANTAWTALFIHGALQADQRVLIHGAAGGVGVFAVQFARWKGAHVIATASANNLDFVRSLGAETVIDYASTSFEQVAHDVDLVLDTVGGETLRRSMSVVKAGCAIVSLLEQPSQEIAQQRGIRAMRNVAPTTSAILQSIAQLIDQGHARPTVERIFFLAQARQAHERSQSGHGRGRIVLHIAD